LNSLLFGGVSESYQDIFVLDEIGITTLGWEYCLNLVRMVFHDIIFLYRILHLISINYFDYIC